MLLLTGAAAGGQLLGTLSGPVWGYVFDAGTEKLRPLLGIPGSSTLGKSVELAFTPSWTLTLDSRHVVASTAQRPELQVVDLSTAPPSIAAIAGIPAGPTSAAASLHGTSAVFYHADAHALRIVSGLPQSPAANSIDLSLDGPVTRMAISDDGRLLVYSVAENGGETLYSWTASSTSARFLMSIEAVGGLSVTGNGGAIVADRSANEVFAIWDAGGAAVRQFLAGARDGVSNPAGVAVSTNNRIYIANADSSSVMALDPSGGYLKTQNCACNVSGLYPLKDSVFRLTDRFDRAIFLLDASSAEERLLFVPKPENSQ
jgi:DNA-binding beta-propeller fold protein YncE